MEHVYSQTDATAPVAAGADWVVADALNTRIIDYQDASENELLEAARTSDGQAFAELSRRCADLVHNMVFSILRNQEDTEDAIQDALLRAYTRLGQFRGSCRFSMWLTTIAVNSALTLVRKRKPQVVASFDQWGAGDERWGEWEFADPSPNAEQIFARRQALDLLSHAANRLTSCQRSILEQRYVEEKSVREAAATLGITLTTAKSRLLRARLTLRSALKRKRKSMTDACY
jgi:RNA polymerase sigma-70 factor (ECF subfamily)